VSEHTHKRSGQHTNLSKKRNSLHIHEQTTVDFQTEEGERFMSLNKHVRSLVAAGALLTTLSPVHAATIDPVSPRELVEDAQLILQGVVTNVEYKNSEATSSGQGRLPHTFVTFAIEQTFKGSAAGGGHITLRFEGGPDGTGKAMLVPGMPMFDIGDRDILFVSHNRNLPCPLVGWEQGRFRVLNGAVYTEQGQEVGVTAGEQLVFGAYHALPEVVTHNLGETTLTFEEAKTTEKAVLAETVQPLKAANFAQFIKNLVQKRHTPQQLATLRPVASADIRRPIHVFAAKAEPPPVAATPTQGGGKGKSDLVEERLLQQSGGDPLFKGVDRSSVKSR
jgi:hypothetical protein